MGYCVSDQKVVSWKLVRTPIYLSRTKKSLFVNSDFFRNLWFGLQVVIAVRLISQFSIVAVISVIQTFDFGLHAG